MSVDLQEQRRVRQRKHVQRSYYRKRSWLSDSRELLGTLTQQYDAALELQEKRLAQQDAETLDDAPLHLALQQFLDATRLTQTLRQEKAELRTLVAKREKLGQKIGLMCAEDEKDKTPQEELVAKEPDFYFCRFIKRQVCQQIARAAYEALHGFTQSRLYATTGATVFGWKDRHKFDGDTFKFFLEKEIRGKRVPELAEACWAMFTSPDRLRLLYPAFWNLQICVIQIIDADNVIMHRCMSNDHQPGAFETVFVVSRFKTDAGYAFVFRSLDQFQPAKDDEAACSADRPQWLDMNELVTLDSSADDGDSTHYSFCGFAKYVAFAQMSEVMLEVLFSALRWENIIVGPPILTL